MMHALHALHHEFKFSAHVAARAASRRSMACMRGLQAARADRASSPPAQPLRDMALRVCSMLEPGYASLAHGVATVGDVTSDDDLAGYDVDDAKALGPGLYAVATFVHVAATVYFAATVIRDMIHPTHDPVRGDGIAADADDPGGGPFDGAPDALTLAGVSRPNPEPRRTVRS